MGSVKTFSSVAKEVGLSSLQFKYYVQYMKIRWGHRESELCRYGYAREWAERFRDGVEYVCSDVVGQVVLEGIDGVKYFKEPVLA